MRRLIEQFFSKKKTPEMKPKSFSAFGENSPKTTLPTNLEGAIGTLKTVLEKFHPELYCDLTTFPGDTTRKELFDQGEVLSDPEYAQYAQEMLEDILQQGVIICRSKLQPATYRNLHEYGVVYFAGAIEKSDLATATSLIGWAKKSPMNSFSKVGMGADDPASTVITHIRTDESDTPFQLMHAFPTGHMERGGPIPAYMHYILPTELGKKLEQDIVEDPWKIEALSEYIVKKAGEELQNQDPETFSFSLLYDNSLAATQMHSRSIAEKVLALFAFRDK